MDSTAYRYLIDQLRPTIHNSGIVPERFIHASVDKGDQLICSLGLFLGRLLGNPDRSPTPPLFTEPPAHHLPGSRPVAFLLRATHEAIGLNGKDENGGLSFVARRRGTELFRLLVQAANPRRVNLFDPQDAAATAMACFLLEACMHFGWCPNGRECYGKRAAHIYFTHCRKSLGAASDDHVALVFCYVWGAWLMAQKTEGIQESFIPTEKRNSIERYQWYDGERMVSCVVFNLVRNQLFMAVPAHDKLLPSPFETLSCEASTGASARVDNMPLRPYAVDNFEMIKRPKINGARWDCSCITGKGAKVGWTVVVQTYQSTVYRIDILRARKMKAWLTSFGTQIEVGPNAEELSPGSFRSRSGEGTTIEILRNPFMTSFTKIDPNGIALFSNNSIHQPLEESSEMVIAWRHGNNDQTIDKTHLLGIFDL
ncbi:MAG: hypothetical protein GF344_11375 [Chitinivibrionales bacterium]|nr:hypothetical protein [Chitinivibrionales bacterium]MBD3357401.1 hypothetical protein [Chitinivibrionales bacterium]